VNQLISLINIATSKFNQKDYSKSIAYLEKAKLTALHCFPDKSSIYSAYILELRGDLAKKGFKENLKSKSLYLEALTIAKSYLPKEHPHILKLISKIDK
jgi:hypothetical protein